MGHYSNDTDLEDEPQKKPFHALIQPLVKVLREQLGPGELDAAARVCKAWAAQLAHDVVHCEMCLPSSHEQLLCQLEQVCKRFKEVHSWRVWFPAGQDWLQVEELKLLWLLGRYKVEKLQLDGRLHWHQDHRVHCQLPVLDRDAMRSLGSLRSLQTVQLSHCNIATPDSLVFLAFLKQLHTLVFGIDPGTGWLTEGLAPLLPHLMRLKQVAEIELHVEKVQQLPAHLPEQVLQLFVACPKLQRLKVLLGTGWGVVSEEEAVVFDRVQSHEGSADWMECTAAIGSDRVAPAWAAAAGMPQQQQQQLQRNWLAMLDPVAAAAAAAAGLNLSLYDLPSTGLAGQPLNPDGESDDEGFWAAPVAPAPFHCVAASNPPAAAAMLPDPIARLLEQRLGLHVGEAAAAAAGNRQLRRQLREQRFGNRRWPGRLDYDLLEVGHDGSGGLGDAVGGGQIGWPRGLAAERLLHMGQVSQLQADGSLGSQGRSRELHVDAAQPVALRSGRQDSSILATRAALMQEAGGVPEGFNRSRLEQVQQQQDAAGAAAQQQGAAATAMDVDVAAAQVHILLPSPLAPSLGAAAATAGAAADSTAQQAVTASPFPAAVKKSFRSTRQWHTFDTAVAAPAATADADGIPANSSSAAAEGEPVAGTVPAAVQLAESSAMDVDAPEVAPPHAAVPAAAAAAAAGAGGADGNDTARGSSRSAAEASAAAAAAGSGGKDSSWLFGHRAATGSGSGGGAHGNSLAAGSGSANGHGHSNTNSSASLSGSFSLRMKRALASDRLFHRHASNPANSTCEQQQQQQWDSPVGMASFLAGTRRQTGAASNTNEGNSRGDNKDLASAYDSDMEQGRASRVVARHGNDSSPRDPGSKLWGSKDRDVQQRHGRARHQWGSRLLSCLPTPQQQQPRRQQQQHETGSSHAAVPAARLQQSAEAAAGMQALSDPAAVQAHSSVDAVLVDARGLSHEEAKLSFEIDRDGPFAGSPAATAVPTHPSAAADSDVQVPQQAGMNSAAAAAADSAGHAVAAAFAGLAGVPAASADISAAFLHQQQQSQEQQQQQPGGRRPRCSSWLRPRRLMHIKQRRYQASVHRSVSNIAGPLSLLDRELGTSGSCAAAAATAAAEAAAANVSPLQLLGRELGSSEHAAAAAASGGGRGEAAAEDVSARHDLTAATANAAAAAGVSTAADASYAMSAAVATQSGVSTAAVLAGSSAVGTEQAGPFAQSIVSPVALAPAAAAATATVASTQDPRPMTLPEGLLDEEEYEDLWELAELERWNADKARCIHDLDHYLDFDGRNAEQHGDRFWWRNRDRTAATRMAGSSGGDQGGPAAMTVDSAGAAPARGSTPAAAAASTAHTAPAPAPLEVAAPPAVAAAAAAAFPAVPPLLPAPAAAAAPAASSAAAAPPLRAVQLNRRLVNPDGMLITKLKLCRLPGLAALRQRLLQLLAYSPAIALQELELGFGQRLGAALAAQGAGRFMQLLLRQCMLLRALRIQGVNSCEAADDAPHLWRAVGQLRGLTRLSFDTRIGQSPFDLPAPPEGTAAARAGMGGQLQPDPPAAALAHKLHFDALLMQVLVYRLQGLQKLEYAGGIPSASSSSSSSNPGCDSSSAAAAASTSAPAGVLSQLSCLTNLRHLSLEHYRSECLNADVHAAQLDMAWLPLSLTAFHAKGLRLGCNGSSVMLGSTAASYAALLIQQRRANTPEFWMAAAAAADEKGKAPMKLLNVSSSSSSTVLAGQYMQHNSHPPIVLPVLHELSLVECTGDHAAVIGCLAHSTGLHSLKLSVRQCEHPFLSLPAIAWLWPRLTSLSLTDKRHGSISAGNINSISATRNAAELQCSSGCGVCDAGLQMPWCAGRGSATAGGGGSSSSSAAGSCTMPDLLDPRLNPELVAAWLWGCSTPSRSCSGSSSSIAGQLLADIQARQNRITWADPVGLSKLAAGLPNLCNLKLALQNMMTAAGSSSSRFDAADLLGLAAAPRLRELHVHLPPQCSYGTTAAGMRSLTLLKQLRLLDVKCTVERPMQVKCGRLRSRPGAAAAAPTWYLYEAAVPVAAAEVAAPLAAEHVQRTNADAEQAPDGANLVAALIAAARVGGAAAAAAAAGNGAAAAAAPSLPPPPAAVRFSDGSVIPVMETPSAPSRGMDLDCMHNGNDDPVCSATAGHQQAAGDCLNDTQRKHALRAAMIAGRQQWQGLEPLQQWRRQQSLDLHMASAGLDADRALGLPGVRQGGRGAGRAAAADIHAAGATAAAAAAAAAGAAARVGNGVTGAPGGRWVTASDDDDADDFYSEFSESDSEAEATAELRQQVAAAMGADGGPGAAAAPSAGGSNALPAALPPLAVGVGGVLLPAPAAVAPGQVGAGRDGQAAAAAAGGQPGAAQQQQQHRRKCGTRYRPSELQAELRQNMPSTSVFLRITRP